MAAADVLSGVRLGEQLMPGVKTGSVDVLHVAIVAIFVPLFYLCQSSIERFVHL